MLKNTTLLVLTEMLCVSDPDNLSTKSINSIQEDIIYNFERLWCFYWDLKFSVAMENLQDYRVPHINSGFSDNFTRCARQPSQNSRLRQNCIDSAGSEVINRGSFMINDFLKITTHK